MGQEGEGVVEVTPRPVACVEGTQKVLPSRRQLRIPALEAAGNAERRGWGKGGAEEEGKEREWEIGRKEESETGKGRGRRRWEEGRGGAWEGGVRTCRDEVLL